MIYRKVRFSYVLPPQTFVYQLVRKFLQWGWSHLLKKSLIENFNLCVVQEQTFVDGFLKIIFFCSNKKCIRFTHFFDFLTIILQIRVGLSTPRPSTAQKMKFSIKDFFSKCDQIRRKLRIWSHLLKKSLTQIWVSNWTSN